MDSDRITKLSRRFALSPAKHAGRQTGKAPAVQPFAARRDRGICRVESCRALPHEIFLSTAYVEPFGGYFAQPSALEIVDEIFDW